MSNPLQRKPTGEAYVWLTSWGLALGIAMVVFLLWVIIANGLSVFWPQPVAMVKMVEGSPEIVGQSGTFYGTMTMERTKLSAKQDSTADLTSKAMQEYQFFTGNKDFYGLMYRFVTKDQVEEITYPKDVLVGERLSYGNAMFTPVQIQYPNGNILQTSDDHFHKTLHSLIKEGNKRRKQYTRIERNNIGKINHELEKIRLKLSRLKGENGAQNKIQKLTQRTQVLEQRYQALEKKASELRRKQKEILFTYRIGSGEERTLPIAGFTHIFAPNQFALHNKLGHFITKFWSFLSENPREANTEGGIFPAIFGTFVMTVLMSIAVMPMGVIAAIYLREYAKQGPLVRSVRIAVNNLAGVPSIVFGVFGLGFFVYIVGGSIDSIFFPSKVAENTPTFGTGGIFWASLTLALMTIPVVVVATEEALASVPRGAREASLACGASKWQTIQHIVLPASAPGILTGLILAMARGAGEVAPLMLVGVVKHAPDLPLDNIYPFFHMERKFMHMGYHIFDLGFHSPDSEAAKPMVFATTFLLILLVVVMNLAAILIRTRLRKKYATSAF